MRIRPIAMACLAALLAAGCGGGSSASQDGQTVSSAGQVSTSYLLACVDQNHNGQCDDADPSRVVGASGASGLQPAATDYVLLESRSATHQRTALLVSEKGRAQVDGLSTLRSVLGLAAGSTLEQALVARHGSALAALLESGYRSALQSHPVAANALAAYSKAVQAASSAEPGAVSVSASLASASSVADWAGSDSDGAARELSVHASTVLSNNESNRLYLFDASASVIDAQQIDLIPAVEAQLAWHQANQTARARQPWLALLDRLASVFVDTASAASSVSGTPSVEVPVLEAGKGIVGAQLVRDGSEAVVLLNMASGKYQHSRCESGTEGLFKVALSGGSGYRALSQSPACGHSGFTLAASDPSGARIVAWDGSAKQLWSIDGATMQERAVIDLQTASPQALVVSPGGHFVAVAGVGQLTLLDLDSHRVLASIAGDWGTPTQLSFAGGVRTLLLASGSKVHTITFDKAMGWLASASTTLDDTVQGLAISPDGDSYVAATHKKAEWRAVQGGQSLASQSLPAGLELKRLAFAKERLMALGWHAEQARYRLYRLNSTLAQLPS